MTKLINAKIDKFIDASWDQFWFGILVGPENQHGAKLASKSIQNLFQDSLHFRNRFMVDSGWLILHTTFHLETPKANQTLAG